MVVAKAKLDSARKNIRKDPKANKVAELVITIEAVEYDPTIKKVVTKNEEELNRLVDEHCKFKVDREHKTNLMTNKVSEKVRIIERNRMAISPTKSMRRGRSDDSES